jgi:3',5'-cyclic AMP phosphodiesterase CpdA
MRHVAHISDLHFGRTDPAIVRALADELNASAPDLIVASGDFTQDATCWEFLAAHAFLRRLEAPVLAVPGNHDIVPFQLLERFFYPYVRYRRYIAAALEPIWLDEEIAVVGVNTVRRWRLEWNWSYGSVNRRQIQRVCDQLNAAPAHLFRIVVGHHPFLPPEYALETRTVLRAERALAAFDACGVGLVLSGHLHWRYARFLKPVIEEGEVTGAIEKKAQGTATRQLLVVQAASATSTRLRGEPNAYNWITISHGRAMVEPRVWDGAQWTLARSLDPVSARDGAEGASDGSGDARGGQPLARQREDEVPADHSPVAGQHGRIRHGEEA